MLLTTIIMGVMYFQKYIQNLWGLRPIMSSMSRKNLSVPRDNIKEIPRGKMIVSQFRSIFNIDGLVLIITWKESNLIVKKKFPHNFDQSKFFKIVYWKPLTVYRTQKKHNFVPFKTIKSITIDPCDGDTFWEWYYHQREASTIPVNNL